MPYRQCQSIDFYLGEFAGGKGLAPKPLAIEMAWVIESFPPIIPTAITIAITHARNRRKIFVSPLAHALIHLTFFRFLTRTAIRAKLRGIRDGDEIRAVEAFDFHVATPSHVGLPHPSVDSISDGAAVVNTH
jgi:hypothetical protein